MGRCQWKTVREMWEC